MSVVSGSVLLAAVTVLALVAVGSGVDWAGVVAVTAALGLLFWAAAGLTMLMHLADEVHAKRDSGPPAQEPKPQSD